jgi:cytoskeletal protein RodZ
MDQIDNVAPEPSKDDLQELPIKDFSYVNAPVTPPPMKSKKRWIIILVILLVVIIAAVIIGLSLTKSKTPATVKKSTTTSSTTKSSITTAPNIQLTTYTSNALNLTVDYPKTWTVSSPTSTSMAITSPITNITNAKNQTVKGKIIVSVTPQGQVPPSFGTSDATAVIASQLMKYSKPTPNQRAQTYITFAQYASTTTLGGLDGIYLTGNNGYTKGQDIPPTDLSGLDPLVSVSFEQCTDANCSTIVPLTISSNDWKDLSFQTPIMDILKSFSFS